MPHIVTYSLLEGFFVSQKIPQTDHLVGVCIMGRLTESCSVISAGQFPTTSSCRDAFCSAISITESPGSYAQSISQVVLTEIGCCRLAYPLNGLFRMSAKRVSQFEATSV